MHTLLSSESNTNSIRPFINIIMEEIKFNIYGTMFHQNGYSRSDCLSFIAATKEEALATCKRLYPLFEIISVWIDESKPEVVKLQPLC